MVSDCLIERDGRILLVKASYRDFWQLPGGHAEVGETPYQTAAREVLEEVGSGIRVEQLLVLNIETDTQGQAETFCFLFKGTYDGHTPIMLQVDELAEFAWVPFNEALTRLHSLTRMLMPYAQQALDDECTIYLEAGQKR